MTKKHLFSRLNNPRNPCNLCPRYPRLMKYSLCFCTFCTSLWLKRTVFTRPKTSVPSVISVAKNPFNQRNLCHRYPRVIKDLRAYKSLYKCKETFTDVMKTLQIKLFMQNKANFRKVKFNVNKVLIRNYDQMDTWSIRKTKPIQSQLKPIKAN
jgi:hypothetical protein